MALALILLFVIGPIAEIYVLLQAGSAFGAIPVVLGCIATAMIGGIILRIQGLAALTAAQRDLQAGRAPVEAMSDGVFLILAAPLLMTPGFITDALGFALLIPAVRRRLAALAIRYVTQRTQARSGVITIRRSDD